MPKHKPWMATEVSVHRVTKTNNLIKPVDLLVESTSDVLCNFVFIFHWDDACSNWSNWVEIHWDDAWSNWSNYSVKSSRIGWKSIKIMPSRIGQIIQSSPVELGGNPLRWCLVELGGNPFRWCLAKLGGNPLRWCLVELVKLGIISMDFHPIRPVINARSNWSNWASSQWISTQFDQA